MVPPLDALIVQLREQALPVVNGCYTLTTLSHLVQALGQMAFASGEGLLLISDGNQDRDWHELVSRNATETPTIVLPSSPGAGLLICGLGTENGFCVLAQSIPEIPAEESARLFDVAWSCAPATLHALLVSLKTTDPGYAEQRQFRLARLIEPANEALLSLINEILLFAARQHSTFAVSNKALQERLRNHEDQTRMIVHDMRAPLHTLQISIKALQRQRFDPEGRSELLEVAQDSADYLLNLIETVLDSASLETSSWSLNLKPLRITTLIQSVCEPLELAARPDQPRLLHQVDDALPIVRLDRALIERVMTNLITNAIKHTPSTGDIVVSARMARDGHAIELSVHDTGSGIAPDVLAHIFDRYYTAGGERVRGTGLGLYFCRLAVEAHGGSIGVESILNQGSTFTVRLPLNDS